MVGEGLAEGGAEGLAQLGADVEFGERGLSGELAAEGGGEAGAAVEDKGQGGGRRTGWR